MTIQELFKLGMDRDVPSLLDFIGGNILNVGAGNKYITGSIALGLPDWDAEIDPIPLPNSSVSGIHCYHFLEHILNLEFVLSEFQRVLISGGIVNIVVPYYNSQCQAQDISHVRCFCEETWRNLFDNRYYDRPKWLFRVHANFIMGIVERNIALFTQLVRM